MSQGKLNGLMPQTPSQPANTGFSPTPNQSTIGEFGNTFGQPGAVGTPGGFGSSQSGPVGTPGANSQPVAPAIPQSYTSGSITNQVGPVAPNDDWAQGIDGNLVTPPGVIMSPVITATQNLQSTPGVATPFTGQSQIMQAPPGANTPFPG